MFLFYTAYIEFHSLSDQLQREGAIRDHHFYKAIFALFHASCHLYRCKCPITHLPFHTAANGPSLCSLQRCKEGYRFVPLLLVVPLTNSIWHRCASSNDHCNERVEVVQLVHHFGHPCATTSLLTIICTRLCLPSDY